MLFQMDFVSIDRPAASGYDLDETRRDVGIFLSPGGDQETMVKNEETRPRSKRTKKGKDMIVEEALETADSVDTGPISTSPSDQETSERLREVRCWNCPCFRYVARLSFR